MKKNLNNPSRRLNGSWSLPNKIIQKRSIMLVNIIKAFFWYEKAAEANLAIAQYNLGMIYFEGAIVEKDEVKAKELWQKAADQGLEAAVKLMYSINNYEKLQKSSWQS